MDLYEKSCGAITNTPRLSLVKLRLRPCVSNFVFKYASRPGCSGMYI